MKRESGKKSRAAVCAAMLCSLVCFTVTAAAAACGKAGVEPRSWCGILQRPERKSTELVLQYVQSGRDVFAAEWLAGCTGEAPRDGMEESADGAAQINGYTVVLDPGHQAKADNTEEPNGPDSTVMKARVTGGTMGRTTGVTEYELNLAISLKLRDELERRGYAVYMTRETHDVNISNRERAQYATTAGADIVVRIHANGSEDTSVSGALALAPSSDNPYVSYLSSDSQNLSECVLDSYCSATGMTNRGVMLSDTMTGINWSTVPVTILEMGYMTNPEDDTNMQEEAYQQKMIQGIADGIDRYFGLDRP